MTVGGGGVRQEALDRFTVGRTTLVVAHRLSTIRCGVGERMGVEAPRVWEAPAALLHNKP